METREPASHERKDTDMRTTPAITRTVSLTAALLVVAAMAVAAPASAAEGDTDGTTAEADERADLIRQRAAVACARIPNVVERSENLQERLAGDEDAVGSLAWLERRAEQAEERGRTELAEVLRQRLEVRTELAELLPLRLDALESAEELCVEADL